MKVTSKTLIVGIILVLLFATVAAAQDVDFRSVRDSERRVIRDPNVGDDRYIFVLSMRNLEFFDVHIEAFKMAGEALGVQTQIMGPSEYDTAAQISAMKSAIATEPDGIVIYPPGPELKPVINQAEEAGIPVVTVTGDVPDSKRTAFVGIDQHQVGEVGGEYLAEELDGEGKVAILTITAPMFQRREDGYRDTFEKYPGIEIVTEGDTQADFPTGISVAKSILQSNPDLDAFVCVDSVGARSAVTAIREAGRTGDVKVIGMDRNNDTIRNVGKGLVEASVAQKGHLSTFYAMMILYNLNHNPMPITQDNRAAGVTPAPVWVNTGVSLVTQENWRQWLRE